jgi:hypothetical protein
MQGIEGVKNSDILHHWEGNRQAYSFPSPSPVFLKTYICYIIMCPSKTLLDFETSLLKATTLIFTPFARQ